MQMYSHSQKISYVIYFAALKIKRLYWPFPYFVINIQMFLSAFAYHV